MKWEVWWWSWVDLMVDEAQNVELGSVYVWGSHCLLFKFVGNCKSACLIQISDICTLQ